MTNKIKILCPPHQCNKCKRIISKLNETLQNEDVNYDLELVNQLEELLKYPTWILPTIIINGHVVAQGYAPGVKAIRKNPHFCRSTLSYPFIHTQWAEVDMN